MGNIIDYLVGHPVALSIAVIVSVMVLFSFMRRLVRLALIVIAAAILYLAYTAWSGGDTKDVVRKAETVGHEAAEKGGAVLKFIKGMVKPEEGNK